MRISPNAQLLCYHCKKPITSRKEFGMGIVKLGFRLEPFHIHCWAEYLADASFGQRFVTSPALKLTSKTEKAMSQNRRIIFSVFAAFLISILMMVLGIGTPYNFLLAFVLGIASVIWGLIYVFVNRLVINQNKQWGKAIALIPEEESP